jgi:hypothetical protein
MFDWTIDMMKKFQNAAYQVARASGYLESQEIIERIRKDLSLQLDMLVKVIQLKVAADMLADKLQALEQEVQQ